MCSSDLIVQEFWDVLPKNIPGLLPKEDIDFTMELILGAAPMSQDPYKMSAPKLT